MKIGLALALLVACQSSSSAVDAVPAPFLGPGPGPGGGAVGAASAGTNLTYSGGKLNVVAAPSFTGNVTTSPGVRMGAGWLTPTVMLDVRSDNTIGGDPGFLISLWRNSQTQTGTRSQIIRQRGTMASPTATLSTDSIFRFDVYGVSTAPGLAQGGEIDADQDQSSGATFAPMAFTWKAQDNAGTLRKLMTIDSAQHWNAPTSTAPALTSCGTSPAIVGSDVVGTVTIGSAITTCTITFHTAWNVTNPNFTPHCQVTSQTASASFGYTVSTSAISLTTVVAGQKYDYMCLGAS